MKITDFDEQAKKDLRILGGALGVTIIILLIHIVECKVRSVEGESGGANTICCIFAIAAIIIFVNTVFLQNRFYLVNEYGITTYMLCRKVQIVFPWNEIRAIALYTARSGGLRQPIEVVVLSKKRFTICRRTIL